MTLKTYWKEIPFLNNFFLKQLSVNRNKIHNIFVNKINYNDNLSILDIGTASTLDKNHNTILQKLDNNFNITCLSNQNCNLLKEEYRNVKSFIQADALENNLENENFDVVYSSATIEHVGSIERQTAFVSECLRLSKKYVFITTPNRFFPLDFHTKIPFIHFLPKKIHRKILKLLGFHFYSLESNLNLMSKNEIFQICKKLDLKKYEIIEYKVFNFTSNFLILIKK